MSSLDVLRWQHLGFEVLGFSEEETLLKLDSRNTTKHKPADQYGGTESLMEQLVCCEVFCR